ncbi:ankyrin repeat domain-containing protein [Bacillus sp. SS-TM]
METALLAATEKNETNTVISLLKKGANINATDSQGRTPLMKAGHVMVSLMSKLPVTWGLHVLRFTIGERNILLLTNM